MFFCSIPILIKADTTGSSDIKKQRVNKMEALRLGIVGTGHLGKLHTKVTKTLSNCQLIGIYDKDPEKAKVCSEEFSVKAFENF
ncbi:MAG: Gfo/Idh/MocA family oxidoreductase, partial [Bacillota bacterium]